jgi:hypothetical protein
MSSGHNGIGISKSYFLGTENMKSMLFFGSNKNYEANNVQIMLSKSYHILNWLLPCLQLIVSPSI